MSDDAWEPDCCGGHSNSGGEFWCCLSPGHDGPHKTPALVVVGHKDSGPAGGTDEATTESTQSAASAASRANQGALLESNQRHRRTADRECTRIPPEALAAVERVLAHRAAAVAEVPGQERWRQTTIDHQTAKALSHAAEAALGTTEDRDTGEHPLAHAAARALLGLALYEMERAK